MTYRLQSQPLILGFKLLRDTKTVFKTRRGRWFFSSSSVKIGQSNIQIKPNNLLGDSFSIFKDQEYIGYIDLSNYRYNTIELQRADGEKDKFQFEEVGYSQIYYLSDKDEAILKVAASVSPVRIREYYEIEVLSPRYNDKVIEELIFYVGETLQRMMKRDNKAW